MVTWFKSSYSASQTDCVEVASWRKASYSASQTACVEVANWRKASYSADQTECVEVADWPTGAAVRDTKHRELGVLFFSGGEWEAFLRITKR